jgi:hypothetical protein
MTTAALWTTVLIASGVCLALKLAGAFVPRKALDKPVIGRVMGLVTVALLAGLFATQTAATGQALHLDARIVAVAVAAIALWRKAPFIVVVILAAVVAAGLRALGWG